MTILFFLKPSAWTPPSGTFGAGMPKKKKERKSLRKLLAWIRKLRQQEDDILIALVSEGEND